MAVLPRGGRAARTGWRVLAELPGLGGSLVECMLHTGRTHQIRVHLKHLGHPLLGDALYAPRFMGNFPRQMLHSWKLGFQHPRTGEQVQFCSPRAGGFPRRGSATARQSRMSDFETALDFVTDSLRKLQESGSRCQRLRVRRSSAWPPHGAAWPRPGDPAARPAKAPPAAAARPVSTTGSKAERIEQLRALVDAVRALPAPGRHPHPGGLWRGECRCRDHVRGRGAGRGRRPAGRAFRGESRASF